MPKPIRAYFISPNSGALGYWRCTLPAYHLQKAGLADTVVDFNRFQKDFIDWADVVVIQRLVGKGMINLAHYCHMRGKKVVYELDDNVWRFPDSPEYSSAEAKKIPEETERVIESCDAVTVTTLPIAEEILERTNKPVHILPNCLDFSRWDAARVPNIEHEHFLVGWMGGHYHVQDLQMVTPGLTDIIETNKKVVSVFIGCCPMELITQHPDRVFLQEFVNIELLPKTMGVMRFKIALAPLYQTEFAAARSSIRLLQYSAMGIPSVVNYWGEYARMIDDGFPCVCVKDNDWASAIQELIDNDKKRIEIGQKAYEYVRSRYEIKENIHKWQEVYENL